MFGRDRHAPLGLGRRNGKMIRAMSLAVLPWEFGRDRHAPLGSCGLPWEFGRDRHAPLGSLRDV